MQTFDRNFEVKTHSDGSFEGFLAVFDEIDSYADIVVKGAFAKSLADHSKKGRMPALLWQHDTREPIGIYTEMRETDKGLLVKGELFVHDIPKAKQAYTLLKAGGLSGMSIGFRTVESELREDGVRLLKEIELLEGSLVTFPAQDNARVASVKSMLSNVREFETFLRDAGFSRKQAKGLIANGYKAVSQCDADELQESVNSLYNSFTGKVK